MSIPPGVSLSDPGAGAGAERGRGGAGVLTSSALAGDNGDSGLGQSAAWPRPRWSLSIVQPRLVLQKVPSKGS